MTNHRRRSDKLPRPSSSKSGGGGRRSIGGVPGSVGINGDAGVRMGTRISISALQRERLRLTTDILSIPPLPKKRTLDLDYDTMETKSIIPCVMETRNHHQAVPYEDFPGGESESLSDSLIERFDNMESETTEPERKIVPVTLTKDSQGRLGIKITGTPSGIYVDEVDPGVALVDGILKDGDRLVAVNGRSLENVPYAGALELIRKSGNSVQFLVSQIS